jgi:hypothetical protein
MRRPLVPVTRHFRPPSTGAAECADGTAKRQLLCVQRQPVVTLPCCRILLLLFVGRVRWCVSAASVLRSVRLEGFLLRLLPL